MGERCYKVGAVTAPTLLVLAAGRARRYGGIKPLAPIGPNGEAVIDFLVGDALRAGFHSVVIVVNPESGPLIEEHVLKTWPSSIDVSFAIQAHPHGTVDAIMAARDVVDRTLPFAVSNADDLYGADAFRVLGDFLATHSGSSLVGFRLRNALVGTDPVTRGVCEVDERGVLTSISERRRVCFTDGTFSVDDGQEPSELDPDRLVSMNLWGFAPSMWTVFEEALAAAEDASEDQEVLIPEVIGQLVAGQITIGDTDLSTITVLSTDARCVGVTHPGDLDIVRDDVARQAQRGERPAVPFDV